MSDFGAAESPEGGSLYGSPICNEVRIRTGKKTNGAVSRALNRAAKDIWQNGRRRELRAYWIEEPPTAKELISLISAKLWADRQG